MTTGDHITLTGLRATAFHGLLPEERKNGQVFIVDLTVWLELGRPVVSDDIAETIHYGNLAVDVVNSVESEPVDLIETVAERIAKVALGYQRATAVRVTLHKPSAPIPVPFDDVSVTITRFRE